MDINAFAQKAHKIAVAHGWWDNNPSFAESVLMCHTELSEAVDEYRRGMPMMYVLQERDGAKHMETDMEKWALGDKPEGVAVEMADCLIRILDWFGANGLDAEAIVRAKCEYNYWNWCLPKKTHKRGKVYVGEYVVYETGLMLTQEGAVTPFVEFGNDGIHYTKPLDEALEKCALTLDWAFEQAGVVS